MKKKEAWNNLFMSYLHGFLSHSLQSVLLVGMSHHKAVTSKVCWSSVDKWNTMSGFGGGGGNVSRIPPPCSPQRATLQILPVTVSQLLSAPEVGHDTFVMCDWELNQVWWAVGQVWMIVSTLMPSATCTGRTWYYTQEQRLPSICHCAWDHQMYSWA